ncbi:MAG: acetyl esterase/lipase [Candidatus Pelagisphaera sp.]|jgi:acetyl esterase/lipase
MNRPHLIFAYVILSLGFTPVVLGELGVVIDHSAASTKRYIGSPSLAVLPDGSYVASHDFFGPGSEYSNTVVFASKDKGETWERIAELKGQFWSSLFFSKGALWIMGTTREYGSAIIRRSDDGGRTWTIPDSLASGLLFDSGEYHTAPMPVIFHKGRIWRAMEDRNPPEKWGVNFRAFVMSAPIESDWLNAESWTSTNRLRFDQDDPGRAWLEGNVVVEPNGGLVNILRVAHEDGGKAAVLNISRNGKRISKNSDTPFIKFPGGAKKFSIRKDERTGKYFALTNWIHPFDAGGDPSHTRNTVGLISSRNLKDWKLDSVVLRDPDVAKTAHQYIDWLIEGEDIVLVSRTAYPDGLGGAHRAHDANYMTFHRIEKFRSLSSPFRSIPESMPLWPKSMPGENGVEGPETRGGCGISNISKPTLNIFLPKKPNGKAVLIVPGGGYGNVCVNVEGTPQIDGLLEQGIAAFVLKYRLPNGNRDVPMWDGMRALQMIRANSERWQVDPSKVGVWGFSAGGHLSSLLSNGVGRPYPGSKDSISEESPVPNFSILFYPVISMADSIVHRGSRQRLLGSDAPSESDIAEFSTEKRVTGQTPPTYLIHCEDDKVVPIENSKVYFESLQAASVESELHIYEKGGHGIGAMNTNPEWESQLNAWLAGR